MQDQEVKHLARHLIEVVNFYEEHPEMMGGAEVQAEVEFSPTIIQTIPMTLSTIKRTRTVIEFLNTVKSTFHVPLSDIQVTYDHLYQTATTLTSFLQGIVSQILLQVDPSAENKQTYIYHDIQRVAKIDLYTTCMRYYQKNNKQNAVRHYRTKINGLLTGRKTNQQTKKQTKKQKLLWDSLTNIHYQFNDNSQTGRQLYY